ncbi:MAG: hypothetical protein A3F43_06720 [Gammaproteobacteria bacterium RIFCSPHIGHO2_12_FULL_42_10]|nr:MAG: hypothetical protein A3F43_06720 [Gammaproteobacteria bacterium RIFCSPHIGHO2_12_FULL_42_10]
MPKQINYSQDSDDDDQTGQGGDAGSGIAFHEFIASGAPLRDDLLSGGEQRRLLQVHQQLHAAYVEKQKTAQDKRQQLKEGKVSLEAYRNEKGQGATSDYQNHPVLSKEAQFSGMDNQVNAVPTENNAETNNDKREELQYQYRLANQPQLAERLQPPKLIRH